VNYSLGTYFLKYVLHIAGLVLTDLCLKKTSSKFVILPDIDSHRLSYRFSNKITLFIIFNQFEHFLESACGYKKKKKYYLDVFSLKPK